MKVVKKAWGEEQWIVNRDYCGKRLLLKRGFQCSLHHHPVKDETFYVLGGQMKLEVGTDPENLAERILEAGDAVHLPPKTWHRFTGITDVDFMEFSSHHDDDDTKRLSTSGPVE